MCGWLVMMSLPVSFVDHVISTGPPDAPTRPMVSKVATTSLKLKWMPPDFDGHSEITTYQVATAPPPGSHNLCMCRWSNCKKG